MARGLEAEINASTDLHVRWATQNPVDLDRNLAFSPVELVVARWSTSGPSCLNLASMTQPDPKSACRRIALVQAGDPTAMQLAAQSGVEASLWLDQGNQLLSVIREVLAGDRLRTGSGLPWYRLTTAERRIVRAVVGSPNTKLAAIDLDPPLSLRTIESHLHHVYRKLEIPGRAALIEAYRLELAIMDPLAGKPGRLPSLHRSA